jgi:hypothetical protein
MNIMARKIILCFSISLILCLQGGKWSFAWQEAPSIKARCHNCDETDDTTDYDRYEKSSSRAPLVTEEDRRQTFREKQRAYEVADLPREIIHLDKSLARVKAPAENVPLAPGSVIFGIISESLLENPKRPTGFTPGTRIASENLRRSLSILQYISESEKIPEESLSVEDYRFLADQAGFALQPDVPLEVEVEAVRLKTELSNKDVLEFELIAKKNVELENRIEKYEEEENRVVPELQEMEKKLQESRDNNSSKYKGLKAQHEQKLAGFLKSAQENSRARKEMRDNQIRAQEIAKKYVDLSVKRK